jgi:transposase
MTFIDTTPLNLENRITSLSGVDCACSKVSSLRNESFIEKNFTLKAIPTKKQVEQIEHALNVCCKVWNFALRERKDWLNSRKCAVQHCSIVSEYIVPAEAPYPNYYEQANALTRAKAEFPELGTVHSQVLQQVLRKLETAFSGYDSQEHGIS